MSPYQLLCGDTRELLATLPAASVQTVITSPPFWGLRSYLPDDHPDKPRELGSERRPDCLAWARGLPSCGDCYVCHLREVFAGVWRVLRDDGTVWLNLGDSFASIGKGGPWDLGRGRLSAKRTAPGLRYARQANRAKLPGLKSKDLIGIPWRVALALQADGWYLRADVVWAKKNTMPESVQDRPTRAHEFIFLLTKRPKYYYDAEAVREAQSGGAHSRGRGWTPKSESAGFGVKANPSFQAATSATVHLPAGRNMRDVLHVANEPYRGQHYATYPTKLIEPCVLAGSSPHACPHCGAPWRRVLEREYGSDSKTGRLAGRGAGHFRQEAGGAQVRPGKVWQAVLSSTTVRWQPGCACDDTDGRSRCVILDPFAGTATTGMVALKHDRRFIGIELSEEYCRLAEERLAPLVQQARMFSAAEVG